jgi:preprotein translocase subunit SecG
MTIVQYLLIAVTVFSSIVLLILILLQKTKADGLGLAFGSGVGEALFGSRAGNILSKLTIIFACVFLGSTLLLSIVFAGGRNRSLMGQRSGVMAGSMGQQAPAQSAPQQAEPGMPVERSGGAPTLPGTYLGDQGNQPAPVAPAEAPAPQAAPTEPAIPAPVETPAQ